MLSCLKGLGLLKVSDSKKHALRYYFQSSIKDAGSAAAVAAAPCYLPKVSRSSNRSCSSDNRSCSLRGFSRAMDQKRHFLSA